MAEFRSGSDVSVDTLTSSCGATRMNPFNRRKNDETPLINQQRNRLLRMFGKRSTEQTASTNQTNQPAESVRSLDTLTGVFIPVTLSMFSVLLFLRVGFCVGHAGVLEALVMFVIAYIIIMSTVFSVCAVSTNGAVEGGGAYFMISRTLGPEFGGSIGALFLLANIFSSALYITGCVEGLVNDFGPGGMYSNVFPSGGHWPFLYSTCVNIFNLIICLVGASMFARTNLVIFVVVITSILSVILSFLIKNTYHEIPIPEENHLVSYDTAPYTGFVSSTIEQNFYSHYATDYNTNTHATFARVFGVVFSGVTGIMSGANMSGELKDPSKNIPRGTILAVIFTFVTYVIIVLLMGSTMSGALLRNNYLVLQYANVFSPFVAIGIFAASLSASLSNLIGASRVLQAVAKDNLFGFLLKPVVKGTRNSNPIAAVLLSWLFVQLVLLIGSYNKIAQITSVFFLLSYAAINLACLGLEVASAPNFRPKFKYFSWHTASIGLLGCLSMMFMINPIYAAISIIICLVLIIVLHLIPMPADWGSISQALIFHQVRKYLLMLDSRKDHIRFWRPQMLLMVSNPRSCLPLISFINDIKKGGLYVIGHVKVGGIEDYDVDPTVEEYPLWLNLIDKMKIKAFAEITVTKTVHEGMHQLVRLSGLGAMKPNTIILGFHDDITPIDFFGKEEFIGLSESTGSVSVGSSSRFYIKEEDIADPAVGMFPDPTLNQSLRAVDRSSYVEMVRDAIKLHKNLCLARHFHLLSKKAFKKSMACTVDVWPINFFNVDQMDNFDNTWMFMQQLACILYMVPFWNKRSTMRVFMYSKPQASNVADRIKVWKQWLDMLRVEATIHVVTLDNHEHSYHHGASEQLQQEPTESHPGDGATNDRPQPSDLSTITREYVQSVNKLIKDNSKNTAICFVYLPLPPEGRDHNEMYMEYLTEMTNNLPPTLLVHGHTPVTSTTL